MKKTKYSYIYAVSSTPRPWPWNLNMIDLTRIKRVLMPSTRSRLATGIDIFVFFPINFCKSPPLPEFLWVTEFHECKFCCRPANSNNIEQLTMCQCQYQHVLQYSWTNLIVKYAVFKGLKWHDPCLLKNFDG